ncbi:hypothetical protein NFI96_012419 [Prochilodus magdalenae]|nr:hypothetical protein NFI96_012419 [Prochilodus magdalenae]
MSVSTFQKITFISCLVLCVSLFLPKIFLSKGKKDVVRLEVGPGHVPPLRYSQPFSEDHDQWQLEPLYTKPFNPEAISRSKGAGKPNLLGQVIPVYGFGIFLYIIYIFFKLTSKDRSSRPECRFPILIPENTMQELPDYEMVQLQARLRQMEGVRERRASKAIHPPARSRRGSRRREERKLRQLKQITRVMLEGRPLEGVSPEVEAEETPYSSDWEGYSEETFPKYEVAFRGRRYPSVILEEPDMDVPTAEELAERMGREEEEDGDDDSDDDNDDDEDNDVYNDDDDEEEEKVKNETDEDNVDGAENNPTECKEDEESNSAEDEEEEDEESEEEVETEPHEAELIKEDDDEDEDDTHQQDEEQEEEEEEVGEDHPCLPHDTDDEDQGHQSKVARKCREPHSSKRQITFSDRRHVFHYPKGDTVGCKYEDDEDDDEEDEEDDEDDNEEDDDMEEEDKQDDQKEVVEKEEEDPLMEAESLGFHAEDECDPEEQEVNLLDFLLTYQPEVTISSNQPVPLKTPVSGTLRMRHKKPKKKN